MKCPLCEAPLAGGQAQQPEPHWCAKCDALWVLPGRLQALAGETKPSRRSLPSDIDWLQPRSEPRRCPGCNKIELIPDQVSGIDVLRCLFCQHCLVPAASYDAAREAGHRGRVDEDMRTTWIVLTGFTLFGLAGSDYEPARALAVLGASGVLLFLAIRMATARLRAKRTKRPRRSKRAKR